LSRPCRTSWLIVGTIAPHARGSSPEGTSAHGKPPVTTRRDNLDRSTTGSALVLQA
jgi:hypothetical protein